MLDRPAQSAVAGSQTGRHILNLAGTFDQNNAWVSPLRMRLKETSKFKRDLIIEYGVRVEKHRVSTIDPDTNTITWPAQSDLVPGSQLILPNVPANYAFSSL